MKNREKDTGRVIENFKVPQMGISDLLGPGSSERPVKSNPKQEVSENMLDKIIFSGNKAPKKEPVLVEEAEVVLQEGVYDRNIFKAVFLAGGSGSGKSTIAQLSLDSLGLRPLNSDRFAELEALKQGVSLDMNDPKVRDFVDSLRPRAKGLAGNKLGLHLRGRQGLLIDGTGADLENLRSQADTLKSFGYDVYMLFVNTSLEVAKKRNRERPRVVPDEVLEKKWHEAQANMGKFQHYFGNDHFEIFDNSEDVSPEEMQRRSIRPFKRIKGWLESPIKNPEAKKWILSQFSPEALRTPEGRMKSPEELKVAAKVESLERKVESLTRQLAFLTEKRKPLDLADNEPSIKGALKDLRKKVPERFKEKDLTSVYLGQA